MTVGIDKLSLALEVRPGIERPRNVNFGAESVGLYRRWGQRIALDVVDAITSLSEVAGNHSRFLYDFSPDAVIYRWTDDFAPRMLYGFSSADNQPLSIPEIIGRIKQGDIAANELIVGASTPNTFDSEVMAKLESLKVKIVGVKAAADEVKRRMREDLKLAAS